MKKNQQVNKDRMKECGSFLKCDFLYLVDLFQGGKFSKNFQVKPPSELDQVQVALDKLLFMIKHLVQYVDDIIVRFFSFKSNEYSFYFFSRVKSHRIQKLVVC